MEMTRRSKQGSSMSCAKSAKGSTAPSPSNSSSPRISTSGKLPSFSFAGRHWWPRRSRSLGPATQRRRAKRDGCNRGSHPHHPSAHPVGPSLFPNSRSDGSIQNRFPCGSPRPRKKNLQKPLSRYLMERAKTEKRVGDVAQKFLDRWRKSPE